MATHRKVQDKVVAIGFRSKVPVKNHAFVEIEPDKERVHPFAIDVEYRRQSAKRWFPVSGLEFLYPAWTNHQQLLDLRCRVASGYTQLREASEEGRELRMHSEILPP